MTTSQAVASSAPVQPRRGNIIVEFFTGVSFFLRGLGYWFRTPGLMLLGLLPALITFALFVAGFLALIFYGQDVVSAITPFANNWDDGLRSLLRIVITIAIIVMWVVLGILLFTALTLIIGEPFYEKISKRVEDGLGGVPGGDIDPSFWRTLPRSIVDSVRLVVVAAISSVAVFLIGLIPVAGQFAGPVLGACLGGWGLALELTSLPFERRGLRLKHRRSMLRQRRAMSLGFGVAAFVTFLIPGVIIFAMPAAVAGSTMLTRRLFGLPDAVVEG